MKQQQSTAKKGYLCVAILFFSVFSFISHSYAEKVGIREVKTMYFAAIQLPYHQKQYIDISATEDTWKGSGKVLLGKPHRAKYILYGQENSMATLDVRNIRSRSPYITFSHFKGEYDGKRISSFPDKGIIMSRKGKELYLSARITYQKYMLSDMASPTFDIIVNYE